MLYKPKILDHKKMSDHVTGFIMFEREVWENQAQSRTTNNQDVKQSRK